jgi:hypothetical protein
MSGTSLDRAIEEIRAVHEADRAYEERQEREAAARLRRAEELALHVVVQLIGHMNEPGRWKELVQQTLLEQNFDGRGE